MSEADAVDVAAAPPEHGRRPVGIVMNGVTGRMGTNQHLIRSILAIRDDGGLRVNDDLVIWPEPVLVGRDASKLAALAAKHGLERWTTDLDEALAAPDCELYFDAQTTTERPAAIAAAIDRGKHVYSEKPLALNLEQSLALARRAHAAGIKVGVVQDKLFLPGLLKLREVIDSGALGRIISVRGDFGYWVFEGPTPPSQRPSWNYCAEDGGGIVSDMFAHWRYVIDNLFGDVRSVIARGATHIPQRYDEQLDAYRCTAEDAAYAIFDVEGDVVVQFNSSWCTRVLRDELLELHVDGTDGSAVAGLHGCRVQEKAQTPVAVWNPDLPETHRYRDDWTVVAGDAEYPNGFRHQWELFLRHVVCDEPFPWNFLEAAKGSQLAELGMRSWREGRVVDVPELTL